jgi:hypothetical protein
LLWSPGQVLEAIVGFDVALMVMDLSFWASIGFGAAPHGLPVLGSWWPGWPSLLLRPLFRFRTPPPFRLNLFLQYKRPEHLTQGKERKHWKAAYFRFALTSHQQRALEACATSLGPGGHVAYGSPAFFRRTDLFAYTENRTLADNTHFAPALQLANHSRYTYVSARAAGMAHSEPVEVQPLSFSDGPPHVPPAHPGDGGAGDAPTPEALLNAAKKAARASVEASPVIVGSREAYERAIERARGAINFVRPGIDGAARTAVDAYMAAAIFARMSGVQWMVSG